MPLTTGLVSQFPRLYRGCTQDLLTAAAANGPGQIYELPEDELGGPTRISVDVISLGTTAAINIEGSDDPAFPAGGTAVLQAAAPVGKTFINDKPTRYIRANQSAITGLTSTVRATNLGRG